MATDHPVLANKDISITAPRYIKWWLTGSVRYMAHHYHNTNTRFDPQNHYSTPIPPGQYGQSIEHPPPPPPGQYGQSVEHPPPPPPGQYGQSVEYPLPPGQYGQSVKYPLPPGQYCQSVEHHSSVSSLHSDIGSYNTADYYQMGVMFREMVHQLAENNMRPTWPQRWNLQELTMRPQCFPLPEKKHIWIL